MRRVPGAPTPRESQANFSRDRVGIVEGSCENRTLRVSIRGKFDLSRNMGYKTRGGGCHVTKK